MDKCYFPWVKMGMTQNSIYSCCIGGNNAIVGFHDAYSWEKENPLWNNWNSEAFQAMRKSMLENGSEKTCDIIFGETANCLPNKLIPQYFPEINNDQKENREKAEQAIIDGKIIVEHYPMEMEIILDLFCNSRCIMCSQRAGRNNCQMLMLPINKFLDEIEEFAHYSNKIILLGGEPTISPNYDNIINCIKNAKGAKIELVTNGNFLKRFVIPNIDIFGSFHISIDAATEKTYHKIRKGCYWPLLIESLDALAEVREWREILFHHVIHPINVTELEAMVEMAAKYHVSLLRFDVVRPYYSFTEKEMSYFSFETEEQKKSLEENIENAVIKAKILGVNIYCTFPSINKVGFIS